MSHDHPRKVAILARRYTVLLLLSALGLEVLTRATGVINFPIYTVSSTTGYQLKPGQQGKFLRKNRWFINDAGFNNETPFTHDHPYTLLAGDSVVYGGNPVDYDDRIGSITSRLTGENIWVAALGGWSLHNELAYLSERAEAVAAADHLVFIFDNGDLTGLAQWGGEFTHPTKPPASALVYGIRKYVLPKLGISATSELPPIPEQITVANDAWKTKFEWLLQCYKGKILFIVYPDKNAFQSKALWESQTREVHTFVQQHSDRIDYLDIALSKDWSNSLYRDGIHPTVEGNTVIARHIAEWIQEHRPLQVRQTVAPQSASHKH